MTRFSAVWRGAGAVERGGLENRCTRKRTEGSNPSLSAIYRRLRYILRRCSMAAVWTFLTLRFVRSVGPATLCHLWERSAYQTFGRPGSVHI